MLGPAGADSVGRRGKTPEVLRTPCGLSHAGLTLGCCAYKDFRVRGRQLHPRGSQRDIVWGRAVSPAYGDPSAEGEVSPEQLLPERSVPLSF